MTTKMTGPTQTVPEQTGPDLEFSTFLANNEFKIQLCVECNRHIFYPRFLCPYCGASHLSWVNASGKGEVYSTSVPRGGKDGDYNISLIDLAEGPRMLSRVEGIAPEQVKIGMKVQAFIGELEGQTVVLFKPDQSAGQQA